MWKKIYYFFDKLEDRVRGRLSRKPIFYAFLGGIGVVFFWRGVWHLIDAVMFFYFGEIPLDGITRTPGLPWWDGLLSFSIGSTLLLLSGVFVSNFIGNEVILSDVKGEQKVVRKAQKQIVEERGDLSSIERELKQLSHQIDRLEKKMDSSKRK